MNDDRSRLKICLAASGGGHLRQLHQLKPFYDNHEAFLVTQATPMGKALAREIRTFHLPDVALGKLRKSPREMGAFFRNLAGSFQILRTEKPDLVLSTGAGLAFNLLALARLFGIRTVFVESLAHVYTPTTTGRVVSKWADAYIVQWEDLHRVHPGSILAASIRPLETAAPSQPTEGGTFVTVGTHGPFPRLVAEVDRLAEAGLLPRPVLVQHPAETPCPHADRTFPECSVEEFQELIQNSRLVITHAGAGSILSVLGAARPTIALARLSRFGEHYDDHQLEILRKFREMGAMLGSDRAEDLESLVRESKSFQAKSIEYESTIIRETIERLTSEWFG